LHSLPFDEKERKRKSLRKIIYKNWWIFDAGLDPNPDEPACEPDCPVEPNRKVTMAVRLAIIRLRKIERTVISQFYFDGRTYCQIAAELGLSVKRIQAIHRRSVGKLKRNLAGFVAREFGVSVEKEKDCIICRSRYRHEIDRLIHRKKREETWKKVIKILKTDYGIIIKSPLILIRHQKCHMQ
jgi:hypothetical protein